jgi:hypothetical protein
VTGIFGVEFGDVPARLKNDRITVPFSILFFRNCKEKKGSQRLCVMVWRMNFAGVDQHLTTEQPPRRGTWHIPPPVVLPEIQIHLGMNIAPDRLELFLQTVALGQPLHLRTG